MRKLAIMIAGALVTMRLVLAAERLGDGEAGVYVGCSGLFAVWATCAAWKRGTPDLTWRGMFVGLAYLLPVALQPGAEPASGSGALALQVLFLIQCALRLQLWDCCTVTGAVFVRVCETGLYGVIRHPLTVCELLLSGAVACAWPTAWNMGIAGLVIAAKAAITIVEEDYLRTFPPYTTYMGKTKWRWLPGVW